MDNDSLKTEDIHSLVRLMSEAVYKAKDSDNYTAVILDRCLDLFGKDYFFSVANNDSGELCSHYPSKIVLLEGEKCCSEADPEGQHLELSPSSCSARLSELFTKARFARCWTRFVVPVIFFNGKHICRSATISSGTEIYGRSSFDLFFTGGESIPSEDAGKVQTTRNWQLFDRIRGQDIKLLKELKIKHICDLMVENKKVKYFFNVTSSEKVDKEQRYSDFSLWSIPYPGCEFFRTWREKGYAGEHSFFNWDQDYVTTTLDMPVDHYATRLPIDWQSYKTWDIVKLSQNYLKLLLLLFQEGDSGILVHCISGWDRTPLFISLLRLSLWADGLVHKSLSAKEVLFLTVAYDWFMFGHDLPDRLSKGEEIFFFCFYFLKFIHSEEFTAMPKANGRARTGIKADGEWLDGSILLDGETNGKYGSCASLCSNSSVTSRSSVNVDYPQHAFRNGSEDIDEVLTAAGIPSSTSNGFCEVGVTMPRVRSASEAVMKQPNSTPVSVPVRASAADSPCAAGSWQLVSGNGSYWESHKSSSSGTACSLPDVPEMSSEIMTTRQARLEEVRLLFYNAYDSVIGFNSEIESSGRISTLLGYIADKVGAKK